MDRTGPGKWANDRQLRRRPLETPFNLSRICGCIKNSGASSPASGNLRGNSDWCKIQHALDLRVSLQLPWLCYTLLHVSLVENISAYNPVFLEHYGALAQGLSQQSGSEGNMQALQLLYSQLHQQSQLFAFVYDFRLFGVLCVCCLPLVFLFKGVKGRKAPVGAH